MLLRLVLKRAAKTSKKKRCLTNKRHANKFQHHGRGCPGIAKEREMSKINGFCACNKDKSSEVYLAVFR